MSEHLARLLRQTTVKGECLLWAGVVAKSPIPGRDYPYLSLRGLRVNPRRLAYTLAGKQPPLGDRTVDAVCGDSLCINPDHLVRSARRKSEGRGIRLPQPGPKQGSRCPLFD